MKKNNLSTVIIWQNGFNNLSEILHELNTNHEIKCAKKIVWQKEEICKNLNKLYQNRIFNLESPKIKEIGGNELFLIVVKNNELESYSKLKHHSLFYFKKYLRDRDKINYIHISDNDEEAYKNYNAIKKSTKEEFENIINNKTKHIIKSKNNEETQIVESTKPKLNNIKDFFEHIKSINYIVLRGFEELEKENIKGDIDILTENKFDILNTIVAEKVFLEKERSQYLINISNQIIQIDLREITDNYYPKEFAKKLLKKKQLNENNIKIPEEKSYFWSLVYHCIIHKNFIDKKYHSTLSRLNENNNIIKNLNLNDTKTLREKLFKYLKENQLNITNPNDHSVNINKFKEKINKYYHMFRKLKKRYKDDKSKINEFPEINELIKYKEHKWLKKNVLLVNDTVIKISPKLTSFLIENEYKTLKLLERYNEFPESISFQKFQNFDVLTIKKFNGKDICQYSKLSKNQIEILDKKLINILKILKQNEIIHRDIRPMNLILNKDDIHLIDFEFAICNNKEIETSNSFEKWIFESKLKNLGGEWTNQTIKTNEKDKNAVEKIIFHFKNNNNSKLSHLKSLFRRYINYK